MTLERAWNAKLRRVLLSSWSALNVFQIEFAQTSNFFLLPRSLLQWLTNAFLFSPCLACSREPRTYVATLRGTEQSAELRQAAKCPNFLLVPGRKPSNLNLRRLLCPWLSPSPPEAEPLLSDFFFLHCFFFADIS